MNIELTEQEANVLLELLNEAVKSRGIHAAQAALFFVNKLQESSKRQNIITDEQSK
jgi:hypothetical protein